MRSIDSLWLLRWSICLVERPLAQWKRCSGGVTTTRLMRRRVTGDPSTIGLVKGALTEREGHPCSVVVAAWSLAGRELERCGQKIQFDAND